MSDFYIFLEEDKGLNQKEIKNLSKEELDKYFQEYVESERKTLDMEPALTVILDAGPKGPEKRTSGRTGENHNGFPECLHIRLL